MFYQNVFGSEFIGVLVLSDRQFSMNFKIPANVNNDQYMFAWNQEPYNLSVLTSLTFNYSFDIGHSYTAMTIDVTTMAADVTAVRCFEIANALNANATFAALYLASVTQDKDLNNWLRITSLRPRGAWKTYISNTGAEQVIRFNKKAGVAELPSYFSRHTIANINNFPDSNGMLIELSDPVVGFDVTIVEEAGLDPTVVQEDWQLLRGRSGLFNFQKITVDGDDRITQIIQYPAGALEGDLGRQIDYVYTGANLNPSQITEIPHVVEAADLVTP